MRLLAVGRLFVGASHAVKSVLRKGREVLEKIDRSDGDGARRPDHFSPEPSTLPVPVVPVVPRSQPLPAHDGGGAPLGGGVTGDGLACGARRGDWVTVWIPTRDGICPNLPPSSER